MESLTRTVTMPVAIMDRIKAVAEKDRRSVQQQMAVLLEEALDARDRAAAAA